MYFPGPQYETPAEVRMPPASWAPTPWACPPPRRSSPPATAAWRCWALPCCPTWPPACWTKPLSEEEVLEAAEAAREKFSALLLACLEHLTLH